MRVGGQAPRRPRSQLGNAPASPPPDGASPPPPKERCPNARTARDFEIPAAAFARNNFPQVDWPDGCTLLKGSVLGRLPPNSGTRPPQVDGQKIVLRSQNATNFKNRPRPS